MSVFFIFLFLLITFGYSAFEKIVDFGSNVDYYKNYFSKTFLKEYIRPILIATILAECIVSLFFAFALYETLHDRGFFYGALALTLACFILICFLLGQRIAKDYEGARGIAIYFIVCILGLWILNN